MISAQVLSPPVPAVKSRSGAQEVHLRINWIMCRANMAGGTKSNRLIAEAMVRRGHEVNIAYLAGPRPLPPPWRWTEFKKKVKQRWRAIGKQRHQLERSTAALIPVRGTHIKSDDVPDADVSIATWWETRQWIADWPARKGIKAYFIRHHELHGGDPERVRATYRMPGVKLVIARWLKRVMAEEYGDPDAVLVPNGVDWSQFDSAPRGRAAAPTVGLVYAQQGWKGMKTAFEALRQAQKRVPGLRVVMFGSTQPELHELGLRDVHFQHRPPQEDLADLYRSADCWLLPSRSEGFGMPGLEAAACRCPIVATRCGGPEDYVENDVSGRLVPVDDPQAMAQAVVEVLSMEEPAWREMSEQSYRMARQFDWDQSAQILERALLDALERNEAPKQSSRSVHTEAGS